MKTKYKSTGNKLPALILRLHLIIFFILLTSLVKSQPANTTCATALTLSNVSNFCSAAGAYTNVNGGVGATFAQPPCWPSPYNNAISRDVWFGFTAVAPNVVITINGNTGGLGTLNDPEVVLYRGNCTVGITIESCGVAVSGTNTVTIGTTSLILGATYLIRVDGINSSQGTFQLCINNSNTSPIPSNDNCNAPVVLTDVTNYCSASAQYTNVMAINDTYDKPSCWANLSNDVWFEFTAVATALDLSVYGDTLNSGTLKRPQIALYTGSCLGGVLLPRDCDTSNAGSAYVNIQTAGLQIGTNYLIRIDGANGNTGTFKLCINNYEPVVSPGQDCSTATPLCNKNSFAVSNVVGFGNDGNEAAGTCLTGEDNSMWYIWTAANNGTLTFDLIPDNPSIDVDFIVYDLSAGCAARTILRCMASSCPGNTGLNATSIDVTEPLNCDLPTQDNYLQQITMTAGNQYGILVNIFQTSGQGFTMNFGGTGNFVGPVPGFNLTENPSCGPNPTVTFTDNSIGATSYQWSFGSGATPATANTAGPHTPTYPTPGIKTAVLTVGSVGGCNSTISQQFTIADTLSMSLSIVSSTCGAANGSITCNTTGGNGTTGSFRYSIDGGTTFQSSNIFNGLSANTYNVVVEDSINCTKNQQVTLTTTLIPVANVPANITVCSGATVAATNFTSNPPGASYTWANNNPAIGLGANGNGNIPAFTATNAGNAPITGTISVTPTLNGCTGTPQNYTITVNPLPTVTTTTVATACGSATGSITATGANGTPGYNYSIDGINFQPGNNFNNLNSGNYTVTVMDVNTCTGNTSAIVANNTGFTASITNQTNQPCFGDFIGSIALAGNGGTAPYQYSIDGATFQADSVFSGLATGNYTFTIQDFTACTFTQAATITQPTQLSATVTKEDASCGIADGEISASGNNGTPGNTNAYTYSINGTTYQNSGDFNNLVGGNYTVYVKDGNNCIYSTPVSINTTTGPTSVDLALVSSTCGLSNGSVAVTNVIGGTGPYIYDYNNEGYTDSTTYAGATGNCSLVVQDGNGCQYSTNFSIGNIAGPTAITTNTTSAACGNPDGSVTILSVTGTTGPYTYDFNSLGDSTGTFYSGLGTGTYSLIVEDTNNCPLTTTITIIESSPLIVTVMVNPAICNGDCNGVAIVSIGGGTSPYTYNWSNGATDSSLSSLCAGIYNLSVRDADNCSVDTSITITEPDPVTADFSFGPQPATLADAICFTDQSTGATKWSWDFKDPKDLTSSTLPDPCHTYSDAGTFCAELIVENVAGCTSKVNHCLEILLQDEVNFYIPNTFTPDTDDLNEGFSGVGQNFTAYEMFIFNRWGNMIFYTNDINIKWDGKANGSSEIIEDGVYEYLINLTDRSDKKHQYIGYVTLLKR